MGRLAGSFVPGIPGMALVTDFTRTLAVDTGSHGAFGLAGHGATGGGGPVQSRKTVLVGRLPTSGSFRSSSGVLGVLAREYRDDQSDQEGPAPQALVPRGEVSAPRECRERERGQCLRAPRLHGHLLLLISTSTSSASRRAPSGAPCRTACSRRWCASPSPRNPAWRLDRSPSGRRPRPTARRS